MPNVKNQSGFTLIELLIVIAIIGILAGVLVSILDISEYQKQARDARRLNDILGVQTAIIDAIATQDIRLTDTTGCGSCDSLNGTSANDGTGWVQFDNLKGRGLKDIVAILPKDPLNTAPYIFSYYSDGNDFELNAVMESKRYQENAVNDGGNDDSVYERGFNLTLN